MMLTITTSIYKTEKYIKKYVKNLLTVGNFLDGKIDFEFIVIANEPSKKELEALSLLEGKKWFSYQSVPREPLYASWNRGIKSARGNVFGFWNVDDVRRPEAMIDGLSLIERGADLVCFPFTLKWYLNLFGFGLLVRKRVVPTTAFDRKIYTSGMLCGPFFIFSKDLYERVGPFDEQFRIAGDFDWCVRAAKITDNFAFSKVNAGEFRVDGGGLSAGSKMRLKLENGVVFKRHKIPIDLAAGVCASDVEKFSIDQISHQGRLISL